jgi:hypothetical protein
MPKAKCCSFYSPTGEFPQYTLGAATLIIIVRPAADMEVCYRSGQECLFVRAHSCIKSGYIACLQFGMKDLRRVVTELCREEP